MQASYELQTRQQMRLTPRLQQSVKLLQMSTLDFNREIAQALSENPFLEEDDNDPGRTAADSSNSPGPGSESDNGPAPSTESLSGDPERDQAESQSVSENGQENPDRDSPAYTGDYPASHNSHDTDVGLWARSDWGMQDALRADLCSYRLGERDHALVEFIIEALDDDGYLRIPLAELADSAQFDPQADPEEWEVAIRLVQQLAAPGLAARSLSECLTLQLSALPASIAGRELALDIAARQLDRLGRREYAVMAKELNRNEDDVRQACELIRRLDPKPGRRFSCIDPSSYVIPDVFVRRLGKVWTAVPNQATIPTARLHDTYARLFREASGGDRSPMAQALQEARWLLRSVEQRCNTIQRVAQAIVARQQSFFDYGEIALRPLMLSEIAEELDVHESTVSRATSNKYLATARGLYEFKHFFSRELTTSSGGTCSSTAVRALIQEMIDAENPQEPLSDVILAQKLAREGIKVARRTVSKYRTQIKVPPAELRRTL